MENAEITSLNFSHGAEDMLTLKTKAEAVLLAEERLLQKTEKGEEWTDAEMEMAQRCLAFREKWGWAWDTVPEIWLNTKDKKEESPPHPGHPKSTSAG